MRVVFVYQNILCCLSRVAPAKVIINTLGLKEILPFVQTSLHFRYIPSPLWSYRYIYSIYKWPQKYLPSFLIPTSLPRTSR